MISKDMIAPCGMDCAICMGHIREERQCPGCRGMGKGMPGYCRKCIIRLCKKLKKLSAKFCFACPDYPCKRLKSLDKRYRSRYRMSMLENLGFIRDKGIRKFLKWENKRWLCKKCGSLTTCHRDKCPECGCLVTVGL